MCMQICSCMYDSKQNIFKKQNLEEVGKGKKEERRGEKQGKDGNSRERGRQEKHPKIQLDRDNQPGRDILEVKTVALPT